MTPLSELSLHRESLLRAYADGLAVEDVINEVFRRIEALDDPGIFLHLRQPEQLMRDVSALGRFDPTCKPLWGLPFAVKDNIDVASMLTSAACPAFAYRAESDAHVVGQLRGAGALLIGKTNLDQFATGLVGVRTPFSIPRNALDEDLIPGGSSSGSAVAVAAGLVSFALGTDTAGSGRVPAAMNGIVGLKPSLGSLSMRGVVPACRTLDTVSIFSTDVSSGYEVLQVASAPDPADPYNRPRTFPPVRPWPGTLRVGVPTPETREFFGDDRQSASYERTLEILEQLGAELVQLDFSVFFEVADLLYDGAWVAERYTVVKSLFELNPDALHPTTRQVISKATGMSAANVFEDFYRLRELRHEAAPLLAQVDVLCVPTTPTLYTRAEVEAEPIATNTRLGTYTNFVNLLDLCGVTVPQAPRTDGRPGSVTILATAGEDDLVAGIAHEIAWSPSRTAGQSTNRSSVASRVEAATTREEIEIAVVGAHMRALPLNHELTDLGGRFVQRTTTKSQYRLYRLAGGPPFRPGMLRAPDGVAIELEVWALPKPRLADFMAGIPGPLCIGTVELSSGAHVKGFLCEPVGLDGAEDISHYAGWRHYLSSLDGETTPAD